MMALMLFITGALAALALGSLAFMRKNGILRLHGFLFFLLFSTGSACALYLLVTRVEV
jgi:hypothetical protein